MEWFKSRWHNFEKEKPDFDGACICKYHNWEPFIATFNNSGFYKNLVAVKVDWWMPLPPPPSSSNSYYIECPVCGGKNGSHELDCNHPSCENT